MPKDALEEMIEERERRSPGYRDLVEAALARRESARGTLVATGTARIQARSGPSVRR
jgi:hypothetical protein